MTEYRSPADTPPHIRRALERIGITTFYPPQSLALSKGLLDGRTLMVATPTASGKTLIAMMAAYNHVTRGGKVLYLTPLRALASEKLQEFTDFLGDEFKAVASTGDYDSADPWLANYDVIITTNEKADSLLRHGAPWIDSVSLLVADEVHMLGDTDRGPTLEMTLTRLRNRNPRAQLLALSATAPNADEIAAWLGAELISLDWRPVPLREGVYYDGEIRYSDRARRKVRELDYNPVISLLLEVVQDGGQVIVFANTRKRAEQYAEKAAAALSRETLVTDDERDKLNGLADELLLSAEASSFTDRVAALMRQGACFHHAGLGAVHRRFVEKAFRNRVLKVLAATPTLAAGVNLPARVVIIPELRRYEMGEGLRNISVTEYKQFCGRAGRPGFDTEGEALTVARSEEELELIMEKYIKGKPERVWSRLGGEHHLRIQTLAVIASEPVKSFDGLVKFFESTFLCHQFGSALLRKSLTGVVDFLARHGFVDAVDGLEATRLGKRVAELYIDPLTALAIIRTCENRPRLMTELSLLQVVCNTSEVPSVPMTRSDAARLERFVEENREQFFQVPDPVESPDDYELFLDSVKTAVLMNAWIEEVGEGELYERWGVEPGDLAVLRERVSWISYAASQLMKVVGHGDLVHLFELLSERVEHGVRPELLPLVALKGVGRVRARNLYNAGYRTIEDLRRASAEELAQVPSIGPRIAASIKSQV